MMQKGGLPGKSFSKRTVCNFLPDLFLGLSVSFCRPKYFILSEDNSPSVLYPLSFPSNFNCKLTRDGKFSDIAASSSHNVTQTQTSYECHNRRAAKKTFWADAVIVVTGTFAFFVCIESLFMLLRARNVKDFMEDPNFHKYYLSSNQQLNAPPAESESNALTNCDSHTNPPSTAPTDNESQSEQQQREFNSPSVATFIEGMKEHIRGVTEQPYVDPATPFHRKPGEGSKRYLTLDHIYTDLVIHENRALHQFSGDREEQLKEYYRTKEKSRPTLPGDIFDAKPKPRKILVVGRPGIGKTMFCSKILRNWASDKLLNEAQKSRFDFKLAFLVKLRKFNQTNEEINLRQLLDAAEYSKLPISDDVWHCITERPDKLLLIFDGFDEYSGKVRINNDDLSISNHVEDSMPVHFLYKKLLSGKILPGATVLTSTRPTAVSFFEAPIAFERIVEILGFNSDKVEEYVDKFTKEKGDDGKGETIKQHIRSNPNLQSFCYIPVNCFIICSCLLHLLNSPGVSGCLPTRLTELYSIAIKIFYFCHDDIQNRYPLHEAQQFYLKPFNALPEHVQKLFKRLGEIAFQGIKEGRLIFESGEVDEQENNGLFHRLPDSFSGLTEGRAQYCFLHLTIQEFLAAKYLVDTYSSEDLQKFVSDHIQDGAWKVVMQFVAGLLAEKEGQSTDIFSNLLSSKTFTKRVKIKMNEDSEERTETLTCWPAPKDKALVVTLFNCMYENNASDREVQKKLAKIGCNVLYFRLCNLSPLDCLALVHALKSVEGILDFDLSFNNLQSLGCIEIAKLLPGNQHNQGFCELKILNLMNNNITDEGVKHLSTALTHTNCTLNSLDLWNNHITDEAVKHLVTALTHTNCTLNSLNLEANDITDKGKNLVNSLNMNCKVLI